MKSAKNGDLSHDLKVMMNSLNQPEIASPVSNGEKSPLKENARMKGQRPDSTWERGFFGNLNPLCLKCSKDCKQSAKVKIIACPQAELSTVGRESEAAKR